MKAWVVTDGRTGNIKQAQALAEGLNFAYRSFATTLRAPWSWLAPHLSLGMPWALPRELLHSAATDPPDLVIGCGRKSALITAWLKKASGCFAAQILDPRSDPLRWDVVICPRHDGITGDNVIQSIGALNNITEASLQAAAARFPHLRELPSPCTAVLIGGSTAAQRLDDRWLQAFLKAILNLHRHKQGSFFVSTSRRTSPALARKLRDFFQDFPGAFWNAGSAEENPYMGFLAHADRFIVTPDSVNLLSEACATGKPVYTHISEPLSGKHEVFLRSLLNNGYVAHLANAEDYRRNPSAVLRETPQIAQQVRQRLDRHLVTHPRF